MIPRKIRQGHNNHILLQTSERSEPWKGREGRISIEVSSTHQRNRISSRVEGQIEID